MLHDTGDQDIGTVAYGIDLDFLTLQVLIHKDRVILCDTVDDLHEFFDLFIGDSDLHALSAEYVGRTYQYGIAQSVGNRLGFLCGIYGTAGCTGDLGLFQNLVEQLSVLGSIYIFCLSS